MTEAQGGLESKLFGELTEAVKPGATLNFIRPDLNRVEPAFFAMYDGKSIPEANLEGGFNEVSAKYIKSLFGAKDTKNVDGPSWYGGLMKDWLGKVSDQALAQVRTALKQGNRAEVLRLFNQAYEAQANKLTSILETVRSQPSDVQLGTYRLLARGIGGTNVAKVAANPGQAISTYAQILNAQDTYRDGGHTTGGHGGH